MPRVNQFSNTNVGGHILLLYNKIAPLIDKIKDLQRNPNLHIFTEVSISLPTDCHQAIKWIFGDYMRHSAYHKFLSKNHTREKVAIQAFYNYRRYFSSMGFSSNDACELAKTLSMGAFKALDTVKREKIHDQKLSYETDTYICLNDLCVGYLKLMDEMPKAKREKLNADLSQEEQSSSKNRKLMSRNSDSGAGTSQQATLTTAQSQQFASERKSSIVTPSTNYSHPPAGSHYNYNQSTQIPNTGTYQQTMRSSSNLTYGNMPDYNNYSNPPAVPQSSTYYNYTQSIQIPNTGTYQQTMRSSSNLTDGNMPHSANYSRPPAGSQFPTYHGDDNRNRQPSMSAGIYQQAGTSNNISEFSQHGNQSTQQPTTSSKIESRDKADREIERRLQVLRSQHHENSQLGAQPSLLSEIEPFPLPPNQANGELAGQYFPDSHAHRGKQMHRSANSQGQSNDSSGRFS